MYYVACLRRWRSGTRPTDLSADTPCRGLEIVATTKRADVETRRNRVFDLLAVSWRLCSSQVHLPTCPNLLHACAEQDVQEKMAHLQCPLGLPWSFAFMQQVDD
jgi:hypothetical protein